MSDSTSNIARRRALARREGSPLYNEKRAQMVRAATVLFKEKGFAATTLSDVADAVGVDRASLYYYVDNKAELLQEAVTGVTNANLAMMRALLTSGLTPPERLEVLFSKALLSFHENYPQVFVYIQEDMTRIGSRKDRWAREMLEQTRAFEETMIELVNDGVRTGWFRSDLDTEIVSQALWGMINWTHRWYRPDRHDHTSVAKTFAALVLAGLRSPAQEASVDGEQIAGPEGRRR
jgi:AcrR family transcriptional regulator